MQNIQIDYQKVIEIHGLDVAKLIEENIKDVSFNINYLKLIRFEDAEDIFERYPQIFLCEHKKFKEKINNYVSSLGIDYVEKLGNNINLWEILL